MREPRQPVQPAPWEKEAWIDDGPLRSEARKATARAQRPETTEPTAAQKGRRRSLELAPQVADDLQRAAPAVSAAKYQERLATAADALDRGRFDDARRMVQPVLRDLPRLAFGHEIAGLAWYRTGQWPCELLIARDRRRSTPPSPTVPAGRAAVAPSRRGPP